MEEEREAAGQSRQAQGGVAREDRQGQGQRL